MADIPLGWKLSIAGADHVKDQLRQINELYNKHGATLETTQKGMRKLGTEASRLTNAHRLHRNILLATNPALNAFTKGLAAAGRAARSVMSITNALNLANIALQGTQQGVDQGMLDADIAYRQYLDALASGDPDKIAEAQRRLAGAIAEVEGASEDATKQQLQNWITFGATAIFTASTVVSTLIDLKAAYATSALASGKFGAALGLIGSALPFAAVAVFIGLMALLVDNFLEGIPIYDEYKAALQRVFGDNLATDAIAALTLGVAELHRTILSSLVGQEIAMDSYVNAWANLGTEVQNIFRRVINGYVNMINTLSGGLTNLKPLEMLEMPSVTHSREQALLKQQNNADLLSNLTGGSIPNTLPPPSQQRGSEESNPTLDRFNKAIKKTVEEITGLVGLGGGGMAPEDRARLDKYIEALEKDVAAATKEAEATNAGTEQMTALQRAQDFAASATQFAAEASDDNTKVTEENTSALLELGTILTSGQVGGRPVTGGGGGGSSNPFQSESAGPSQGHGSTSTGVIGSNGKWYSTKEEADFNNTPTPDPGATVNSALGFDGIVTSPTTFKAGEAGAERVSIKPINGDNETRKGLTIIVNIHNAGSVLSDVDLRKSIDRHLKSSLKSSGFV